MNAVFSKKRVGFIALFIALILSVSMFSAACSNNNNSGNNGGTTPKQADLSEVYTKLVESGKLPALTKVPERDLSEVYGIDKEQIKQWVFGLSENYAVNAGEVALFEVKDEAYAATLQQKLQNHLDQTKRVAKDYSDPHQSEKLDHVEVKRVGNYVYLVVGEDYSALMQILKDNIG
ncbi:MAG: DUF4358 domain-containing protein [Clostridia bacterium]|nr:DUF4358 domain-containing protein [Clostridia bacterium]